MGLPGQNPLLDLSSRFGFMELCSTCILHIVNMSITTDAQKGSDSMTSAFKGEPGSRVIQENSYSIRVACQRSQDTLLLVRDTARSKAFPALKGPQQQLVSVVPGPIRYKVHNVGASICFNSDVFHWCQLPENCSDSPLMMVSAATVQWLDIGSRHRSALHALCA